MIGKTPTLHLMIIPSQAEGLQAGLQGDTEEDEHNGQQLGVHFLYSSRAEKDLTLVVSCWSPVVSRTGSCAKCFVHHMGLLMWV